MKEAFNYLMLLSITVLLIAAIGASPEVVAVPSSISHPVVCPLSPTSGSVPGCPRGPIVNGNPLECFAHPCSNSIPLAIGLMKSLSSSNGTVFLGLSMNSTGLRDLQQHRDEIKISLNKYINSTLDALVNGKIIPRTECLTLAHNATHGCHIIFGVVLHPCPFPERPSVLCRSEQ